MSALTVEQEAACSFSRGSVLVAAAAGAGKTTTLSERVVRRCLSAGDPVDIDRFLLVTFTEKAALEMRLRIAAALEGRAKAGDRRAEEQLERLPQAHISTIHGFCLRLLREEWQAAGLDPETAMLDERQAELLRRTALDGTLERAYAQIAGMPRLVAYFGGMGEDEGLREALLGSMHFLDTLPEPQIFLRDALARHARREEFEAALARVVRDDLRRVEEAASLLRRAAAAARAAGGDTSYARALDLEAQVRREAAGVPGAAAALETDWSRHVLRMAELGRFSALAGNGLPEHQRARQLRERAKGLLAGIAKGLPSLEREEIWQRTVATQDILRDYGAVLLAAMDDYRHLKRNGQFLDFADLEQEAYRLLHSGQGGVVARGLRERFREVLVDEFQDVNPLQAAIIAEVSRHGEQGNLFAVGDVKQSIYGFRHAAPGIFLEREAEAAGRAAAFYLRENFRSRPEILEVANGVFGQLMQEEEAPRYDARAELRAGRAERTLPPDPDPRVRFAFVAAGAAAEDSLAVSPLQREADWIAREIGRLVAARQPVWDPATQAVRPVRFGDCAVLLRSLQGAAATFDDVFALRGVPATVQRNEGYLAGLELQTLSALLRAVELPERDWDLLVTLRAPWFALSLDEVYRVREAAGGQSLWQGLRRLARQDQRMAGVWERIEAWRALSLALPLDRLTSELLAQTDYAAHVAALPRGAQRRRDILAFQEAAERFAGQGQGGIGTFLQYFEELSQQHLDMAPPDVEMGDAVRVTSIHRSKGLEFPIVFVAGLGRQLPGTARGHERIRLHRSLGIAAAYPDEEGRLHPTAPWQAIDAEERREGLHEEIRLLYVAMTRARDRLYLTSAGEPQPVSGPLDAAALRTARSVVGWLRAPLAQEGLPVALEIWRGEEGEAVPAAASQAAPAFDPEAVRQAFAALPDRRAGPPASPPLRLSASAFAEAGGGYGAILRARRRGGRGPAAARAAGILTHRLLELVDLRDPPGDLVAALADLVRRGALPPAAQEAIDLADVGRFLASDTAARIRGAWRIERELEFSVLADPSGRPDPAGGSLLQGKIDLLMEDAAGWLIVDFKTDHIAPEQVPRAAQAYRGQVEAYRQALRAVAGIEAQAVLYFLKPGVPAGVPAGGP